MEERILHRHMVFTLREILGIMKREFHNVVINMMKRHSMEMDVAKLIRVNVVTTYGFEVEENMWIVMTHKVVLDKGDN